MKDEVPLEVVKEQLRQFLIYDPDTGIFTARVALHKRPLGSVVGTVSPSGYTNIYLGERFYRAHRLAFLWAHGRWPAELIDHINGQRSDNRLSNLREATRSQNLLNQGPRRSNRNGLKGVTFCASAFKWIVTVRVNGRNKYVGRYNSPDEAHEAYKAAALKYHGEFARVA